MTAKLPFIVDPATVRDPVMCRRRQQLPEPIRRALADRPDEHGLPLWAVLAGTYARTVADWSAHPQIQFVIPPDGSVAVDMDPRRSFIDCTRDIHNQVDTVSAPALFSLSPWLNHKVHRTDDGGGLELSWDSADAVFPAGMIDSMTAAHEALFRTLAEAPHAWTGPAPDCLPPDQVRVRHEVNTTTRALDDVLPHRPFWQQASRTPDAIAVIGERTLTYLQLRRGAAILAQQIRPHRMVAVIMHKGWEQVLAGGAVYVPISPDLPTERLHHLLEHAEITLAVTQPGVIENLPVPHIEVDGSFLTGDEPPIRWERKPSDLAYIIYTSGSTGLPKGVSQHHESVRQRPPRRYSVPHGFRRLGRSLSHPDFQGGGIGDRLLTFHARAADQAHVASMPGTTWPVNG
jgi:non-ribosomal peptide synthetase component F